MHVYVVGSQSLRKFAYIYRIVKLTSPNLNYFIIVGSLLLNVISAMRVTQNPSGTASFIRCQVSEETKESTGLFPKRHYKYCANACTPRNRSLTINLYLNGQ